MFAYAFFCSKRKPYLVLPLSLDLFVMGKIRLDIAALLFDGISHYMPGEREGGGDKKEPLVLICRRQIYISFPPFFFAVPGRLIRQISLFLIFVQPAWGGSGPRLQIMLLFSFRLPERRAAANETKYVRKAAVRSVGKKGRTWKSDVG